MAKFERSGHRTNVVDGVGRVLIKIMLVFPKAGHKPVKGNTIKTIMLENTSVMTVYNHLDSNVFNEHLPDYSI